MHYQPFLEDDVIVENIYSRMCGLLGAFHYVLKLSQGRFVTSNLVESSSKLVFGLLLIKLVK